MVLSVFLNIRQPYGEKICKCLNHLRMMDDELNRRWIVLRDDHKMSLKNMNINIAKYCGNDRQVIAVELGSLLPGKPDVGLVLFIGIGQPEVRKGVGE